MRLIIDTDNDCIICPKTFFADMAKTNDVLRSVGQPEVDHKAKVREYFESAIKKDLVRAQDVRKK